MTAAQRRSSATMRLAMISLSAMDSAMVRFTLLLLCVSDALTKIATSEKVFSHPQRVVESLAVGHQHHQRNVVGHIDAAQHLDAVGQLRDDVGPHKTCHLDALQAGAGELVDQVESCRRWRWFPVRSEIRRAARLRGSRRVLARSQAGPFLVELVSKLRGGDRGHPPGPFADAAAAQVCDAVFGDDGVDVGARGGDNSAIECGFDR